MHVLFECGFARTVWALAGLLRQVVRVQNKSCFEMMVRLFQTVTRYQCVMVEMICWSLWNRRNKWVWDQANGSAFGVKEAALNLLTEWRKARVIERQDVCRATAGLQVWSKPPVGWKKVTVDVGTSIEGYVGIGRIIRDEGGQFLRGRSGRIVGNWKANEAEALSIKEALFWAKSLGSDYCIFESDSQQLIEACKGKQGASYFHTIVSDIIDLSKYFDHVLFNLVRRSANSVAHLLATHSLSDLREWVDYPPQLIHHVLHNDCS
ncbi:uncharacterized protein LOC141705705 [Apium graveolens]|uniref:uncharacterized protein LOC141705705 n=1 Tax=Apium graveolens TaxID=4045 RepID=UPI003D7B0509